MADGRVGEEALEVMLERCDHGADQQRRDAGPAHQPGPFRRSGQRREQARQQEDAGLHHGGRVQVGRHRRRCCHGVGQPEMEGELRRLGKDTEEDKHQRRHIERVGANRVAAGEDDGKFVTADDFADQQEAGEHRQAASAGDRQRKTCAAPRSLAFSPVGDEQERREAGQLPENQQLNEVFGEHDAEHRAHEQQQIGIKSAKAVLRREVVVGIENDQQADAQNQGRKQQAQPVEAERDVEAGRRYPGESLEACGAGKHRHEGGDQLKQCQQGDATRRPGRVRAPAQRQPGDQRSTHKGRQNGKKQAHEG